MDQVLRTEARGTSAGYLASATVALFIAAGILVQWTTHLNHDVAWVLYSTGKMLDGAVYGRDIIEPNPPLAWFLTMPAAAAARLFGQDPIAAFRVFVVCIALIPLAHACLRWRSGRIARAETTALIVTLAYALFIGCYRDFGQREYLSLVLVLPYLLLTADRLGGAIPSTMAALAIGIAAGLGCALKPYFLAVPVLVELAAAAHARQWRSMFRAETMALGSTVAASAAAVLILTPAYLRDVVPMVKDIYWAFNIDAVPLFFRIRFELIGLAAALVLYWCSERPALQTVILAACLGYLASYLVQMKGYTYHAFPLRALVLAVLSLQATSLLRRDAAFRGRGLSITIASSAALLIAGANLLVAAEWYRAVNVHTGSAARRIDDVIALVQERAAGRTFLALSTHPYPGFPVVLYTDAQWGSRTNSQFLLPAIAKLRAAGTPADDPRLRAIEERARVMLREDIERTAPALILVDVRRQRHALGSFAFDYLSFYLEDPQLLEVWSDYSELAPLGGFRVFVRNAGGATP